MRDREHHHETSFEREIIKQFKALNKTLDDLKKLLTPHARSFRITYAFESMDEAGVNSQPGGSIMPNTNIPGPIPPNTRVVLTVVPLAADGVTPMALDGTLQATNDQAQFPVIDSSNPLSFVVRIDPPSDITLDSTITLSDTMDSDPTATVVIDWNGPIVVHATGFGVTAGFEPIV